MKSVSTAKRRARRFALMAGVAASITASAAAAASVTFNVNQSVGTGSVKGTITTNGAGGTLSSANITAWNLQITAGGVTTNLTSTGSQSQLILIGQDVTVSGSNLLFNYGGRDSGYLLFQASSPGVYSGYKYYCDSAVQGACASGASVVPGANTDPSAQYDHSYTGLTIIGVSGPTYNLSALYQSIAALTGARTAQMLVGQLESQLLLGLNEQVSCGNCGGADANFGSASLASHGRYALTPEWTFLGGGQLGEYKQRGADVSLNVGLAGALQYDPAGFGKSRPFAAAGVSASLQNVRYQRSYASDNGVANGAGSTRAYDVNAYVQAGWVDRVTPRDEAAASVSYSRTWQIVNAYTEGASDTNPLNATVPGGTDTLDTVSASAQYTHLFGRRIEVNLNGGVDWAFNSHSGLQANIADLQIPGSQPTFVYYQIGGRIGYRVMNRLTVDAYVDEIIAPRAIGSSVHGGFGARWAF